MDIATSSLCHAHGESEQFHGEIKTDMGMERFPSGKFDANELFLELAIISLYPLYNRMHYKNDNIFEINEPLFAFDQNRLGA